MKKNSILTFVITFVICFIGVFFVIGSFFPKVASNIDLALGMSFVFGIYVAAIATVVTEAEVKGSYSILPSNI